MFKNVLVGIDGRPNGRDAIALASRLLDDDGKMALAHVHSADLRVFQAMVSSCWPKKWRARRSSCATSALRRA